MPDIVPAALLASSGSPVVGSVGGDSGHVGAPVLAGARFGRRSSRGVLFGLSRLRLAAVAGAFVFGAVSHVHLRARWRDRRVAGLRECPAGRVRQGAGPLAGGVGTGGGALVVAQGARAAPLSDAPDEAPPGRHVGPVWGHGPDAGAVRGGDRVGDCARPVRRRADRGVEGEPWCVSAGNL
jgi:hypothetical protein